MTYLIVNKSAASHVRTSAPTLCSRRSSSRVARNAALGLLHTTFHPHNAARTVSFLVGRVILQHLHTFTPPRSAARASSCSAHRTISTASVACSAAPPSMSHPWVSPHLHVHIHRRMLCLLLFPPFLLLPSSLLSACSFLCVWQVSYIRALCKPTERALNCFTYVPSFFLCLYPSQPATGSVKQILAMVSTLTWSACACFRVVGD